MFLFSDKSVRVCSACAKYLRDRVGFKCSGCPWAIYCNEECRREHWAESHRSRCVRDGKHGIQSVMQFREGEYDVVIEF